MRIMEELDICSKCQELDPPPDDILRVPPPPPPPFLVITSSNNNICDHQCAEDTYQSRVGYVELTEKEAASLLILGVSSIVLFAVVLCAILLLRYWFKNTGKTRLKKCEPVFPRTQTPAGNNKILWTSLMPDGGTCHHTRTSYLPRSAGGQPDLVQSNRKTESNVAKRPSISSPTKIENPNILPLNLK